MSRRSRTKRRYGSAAERTKRAAAQAGPAGSGGTMFQNIPSGIDFYNPEEGKITLRILPYIITDPKHPDGDLAPVDDIWYKRPFKRFRSIGPEQKPYISPRSIGKPCPISEYYAAAKADPSISDKEANKAKAQDCVMYNVQIVDRKGNVSDPMFWWYSYHLFEKQLKKELMDPDNEEFLTFMDLEGGFDIRIRWEKESFQGNDFLTAGNIIFIERDDIDEDVLDQVVNLDEVLNIKSYDELNRIFLELDDDQDENNGSSNDEKPTTNRRGRSKAKSDDEDESEQSKSTTRKRKSSGSDQEEPVRRGRRTKKKEENPCPEGFVFGDDWDSKTACDDCKKFDECGDKFEEDNPKAETKQSQKQESKSSKNSKTKSSSDSNEQKCPYGLTFGKDCDTDDACNECEIWDDCMDAQEEMEAAGQ